MLAPRIFKRFSELLDIAVSRGAAAWLRLNTDGTVTERSASETRTDLGLGSLATQNGTFSGTSSGTNTGDQTSVTGNAGTATALQTARTINGASFNGTADIVGSVMALGTIATTTPNPVTITQTWNNASLVGSALQVSVTDTASAATSNFAEFKVGGTQRFVFQKNGCIGIGTATPNLLLGATFPGKLIHIEDNTAAQFGATTAGGYASFVMTDSTAATDAKTFEWHVANGAGRAQLVSVTDAGALNRNLIQATSAGAVSIGNATPITGCPLYVYGAHATDKGVLYVEGTNFGFIGVNGPASGGCGWLINKANTVKWIGYTPGSSDDFVLGSTNAATERFRIAATGSISLNKTITAGATTGAQTINKPAGSVNFAAAATSLVVTNSLVTTSSVILATVATNDATMSSATCVAASGSFTIRPDVAPTAETRVNFLVIN